MTHEDLNDKYEQFYRYELATEQAVTKDAEGGQNVPPAHADPLVEGLVKVLYSASTRDEERMKSLFANMEGYPVSVRDHSRLRAAVFWAIKEGWLPEHFRATFDHIKYTSR